MMSPLCGFRSGFALFPSYHATGSGCASRRLSVFRHTLFVPKAQPYCGNRPRLTDRRPSGLRGDLSNQRFLTWSKQLSAAGLPPSVPGQLPSVGIRYGAFALKISSEIDPAYWIAIGDRVRSKPSLPPLRRIQMSYHVRRIRRESPKSKPRSIKTLQKPNGVISPRVQKVGG